MEAKERTDSESVNIQSRIVTSEHNMSNDCIANIFPVSVMFFCCALFLFVIYFLVANW